MINTGNPAKRTSMDNIKGMGITKIDDREIEESEKYRERISQIFRRNMDVVANLDKELRRTQMVKMKINTGDHPPIGGL